MQLQTGKRYVLRNGAVTAPLEATDHEFYPFGSYDAANEYYLVWTADGHYYVNGNQSDRDIVAVFDVSISETSVNPSLTFGLYLVSTDADLGYYSFRSFVVCAPDECTARNTDPMNGGVMDWSTEDGWPRQSYWCSSPDKVKVEHLGVASAGVVAGIVCSSYQAG